MSKSQGGRYILQNGIRKQVQAPTIDRFREVYSEEEEAKDNDLVEQVIDTLRALEKRAEELKPGIADDPNNALPELAGRWKDEGFPKAGLAMLHHMMVKGGRDLLAAATAWEVHRNAIKSARNFYPAEHPNEPLKLALWEHGLSNYSGFPTSSFSSQKISNAFEKLTSYQVEYFGQGELRTTSRQEVAQRFETKERELLIANWFFQLWSSDPKRYPTTRNGMGFLNAADQINEWIKLFQSDPEHYARAYHLNSQIIMSFREKGGVFVGAATVQKVYDCPGSMWHQSKLWGFSKSTRKVAMRKRGKN
ncbi:hypothetical protein [Vreelandella sp. TE19]